MKSLTSYTSFGPGRCIQIGQLHLLKNSLMQPIGIELLKGGVCRVHLLLGMIYLISGLKIQMFHLMPT
nr:hypothetical protein [Tanacetum cinerariifolium]